VLLPPLLLQEVRGKFDLKEPYYRQQVQWMMQMTQPAADGASLDDGALLPQHQQLHEQQQQQAPLAVAQQQQLQLQQQIDVP
jgi:ABC-type iron transport system FetAB ATPase subunit